MPTDKEIKELDALGLQLLLEEYRKEWAKFAQAVKADMEVMKKAMMDMQIQIQQLQQMPLQQQPCIQPNSAPVVPPQVWPPYTAPVNPVNPVYPLITWTSATGEMCRHSSVFSNGGN